MADKKIQEMVDAIRADSLVGRGTCTMTDECRDNDDLIYLLDLEKLSTIKQAVEAARDGEELDLEMATNARWGGDDDPEIKRLKAFRKARKQAN